MTYTITHFGNDTTPALPDLDQNFDAVFLLTPVPCAIAGTNVLTFTQNAASQAASGVIAAYANGLQICGVVAQTNSGSATAALGTLPALNIYKPSSTGPHLLTGGDMIQNNAITLRYDSTLDGGTGGWQLIVGATLNNTTVAPALVRPTVGIQWVFGPGGASAPTLTGLLAAQATLTYTAIVPNATQDQTFTVPGLLSTDGIMTTFPIPVSTGLTFSTYFAAGDTVTGTVAMRCANVTAASTITPGAITVGLKGIRTS